MRAAPPDAGREPTGRRSTASIAGPADAVELLERCLASGCLCVAVLTAAGGTAAAAASEIPAGQHVAQVPWRHAGPGWFVAEYSAASLPRVTKPMLGLTTFYLVSPAGRRHAFYVTRQRRPTLASNGGHQFWRRAAPGGGADQPRDRSGGLQVQPARRRPAKEQEDAALGHVVRPAARSPDASNLDDVR